MMTISCLMVTQASRSHLLGRALESYRDQSYPAHQRELVIVHHDGPAFSGALHQMLSDYRVAATLVDVPRVPLGALRNAAIVVAGGDLLCQWDDDDFCHPNRLAVQTLPFADGDAVAASLSEQLYWFLERQELFVRRVRGVGIHGTVMVRRAFGLRYPDSAARAEDTHYIRELVRRYPGGLKRLDNRPHLYVRTFHGANTWDFDFHYRRLEREGAPADWLLRNRAILEEQCRILRISGAVVRDFHGPAFSV